MSDRRSQVAVLFLVGAMALYLGGSDAALAYVKAGLQPLLVQHCLRLPVAQVSGWCANQLGHLMIHLKLAAVHAQHILLAAVQDAGERFHGLRFACSRRT